MNAVEKYRSGEWVETPEGINQHYFRDRIKQWSQIADIHGIEALRHSKTNKERTAEDRYQLVARVLAGESQRSVAISAGINSGLLSTWVQRYNIKGYEGLNLKKGRPKIMSKHQDKKCSKNELNESEREELIRLRAENEYIKTENAVIKKEIALRHKKWAAQLKAKKQHLSKHLEKKDIP